MAGVTPHLPDDNNTPLNSGTPHTDDLARTMATLALAAPTGNVSLPARTAERHPPAARTDYLRRVGVDASPVGFSPTGDVPPDALADVMARGSHALRSSKRDEVERAARAGSIARHVDTQLATFLEMCAAAELFPPISVRVVGDVPPPAQVGQRDNHPQEIYASNVAAATQAAVGPLAGGQRRADPRTATGGRAAHHTPPPGTPHHHHHQPGFARRERLRTWPVLYWRGESFPTTGRSLHLFIAPDGRCFEGRDDPWPLTVVGRRVRVWPVDPVAVVAAMAEVDARRSALHLVHGMAHLLWRAGVSL